MKRVTRAALVAVLILAVGGGVAWATGLVSGFVAGDGTITACIQKDSYGARIVPAGTACRSTETALTFNQRGVQGPQGPQGQQGEQGLPGANGISLTATPLPAGSTQCAGNGGVAIAPANDPSNVLGDVCNGAPGKDGTNGVDGKDGTNGTNGVDGKDGKDGINGTNGTDLIGSACALPDGTAGTVQMSVAANGAISFVCHTSGGGGGGTNLCPTTLPSYPNSVTTCDPSTGTFGITCIAGFTDANGNIADGCEAPVGLLCNGQPIPFVPHGNAGCVNGELRIVSCDTGFVDVDGAVGNGCEVNLMTDVRNCGAVGNVVSIPNGVGGCVNGMAVIAACNAGFADADKVVSDGCEVNVLTDPSNCGIVGNHIPPDGAFNAHWACVGGSVMLTGCLPGWTNANGSIVDGCEQAVDPDQTGNTQATALDLGSASCDDAVSTNDIAGSIANAADNDWYRISATGGFFCLNDFDGVLNAPPGVVFDVLTNAHTVTNVTSFSFGSGFYSDGTVIFFRVHSLGGAGSYDLHYHL